MTPRIYLPRNFAEGETAVLDADLRRYVEIVLRMGPGERLILFNGKGRECDAVIGGPNAASLSVTIMKCRTVEAPSVRITLAQALPKSSKMDLIVQKATELGVAEIIPFESARSIPRLTDGKAAGRVSRWQKIAVEASRQCGRTTVPEIRPVATFGDMLCMPPSEARRILFWEAERELSIGSILRNETARDQRDFFIVVGPEGGFSWSEVEEAKRLCFVTASLGRLILRTETAPLAILSIIQYETGSLGTLPVEIAEE